MKRYFYICCLFLAGLLSSIHPVMGQEKEDPPSQGILFGLMTSNRGAGLEVSYLQGTGQWQRLFNLDLYYVRSLHEVKVEPYPFPDRKYVFGKVNNFWILNPSFGLQYHIASPSSYNLLDMKIGVKAGPALGVLNPYYIKLCGVNGSCVAEPFNPDIHSYQAISGRANILTNDIQPDFRLGLSIKAFAFLDFNNRSRTISGIRFGVNADLFPNSIPIMLENEDLVNPSTFFAATVGFVMGGHW